MAQLKSAELPHNEVFRLAALRRYELLDSDTEQSYDDITYLASQICGTPIALISLIDEQRQWFKSKVGLDASETHRELAFCAHAILGDDIFEVNDTLKDERFADNPLVTSQPNIRFYAGVPLATPDGYKLGTLCAIDDQPRQLSLHQRKALQALARQLMTLFNLRLQNIELRQADEDKRKLLSTISHDLRSSFNGLLGYSKRIHKKSRSLSADQVEQLSLKLVHSAERVYKQFDRVLEWASSQMRALTFEPEVHNIGLVVNRVEDDLRELAEKKNIQLTTEVSGDCQVIADSNMLYTVLLNLTSNAIKFTPAEGSVTLTAEQTEEGVTLKVRDTGVGMNMETLDSFIKHGRLTSTRGTENEAGTGLGLVLVKEYLDYHGSFLCAKSTPDEGSEFYFLLKNEPL